MEVLPESQQGCEFPVASQSRSLMMLCFGFAPVSLAPDLPRSTAKLREVSEAVKLGVGQRLVARKVLMEDFRALSANTYDTTAGCRSLLKLASSPE